MTTIYSLKDPRTNEVRYIGKAINPQARFQVHISTARHKGKGSHYHSSRWISSLLSMGLFPIQDVLEVVDGNGEADEIRWIAFGKQQGWNLTNHTDGGEGGTGRKHSTETRRKLSEKAKLRGTAHLQTPEAKAKSISSRIGKPLSELQKMKISEAKKGVYPEHLQTPEVMERSALMTAEANMQRVWSAESKRKASESAKGRTMSEDTKQKIQETMRRVRAETPWSTRKAG